MQQSSANTYTLPVAAEVIEATFYNSPAHTGPYKGALDIAVPEDTPVLAPQDGVIIALKDGHAEYGPSIEYADKANWIQIKHDGGEISDLIHLKAGSISVKVGDMVKQGQKLARTGLSGWITDPHLHWAVFHKIPGDPGFETLKPRLTEPAADLVASKEIIVIPTDREGLYLRQYALPSDDKAYFELQSVNRDYWAEYGNKIYETLAEVKQARLNPKLLKFGYWDGGTLIGDLCIDSEDGKQAELGISLDKKMSGRGLASSAFSALTAYALDHFERVFAEVDQNNQRSIAMLERAGYSQPTPGRVVKRDWGDALVYEAAKMPSNAL